MCTCGTHAWPPGGFPRQWCASREPSGVGSVGCQNSAKVKWKSRRKITLPTCLRSFEHFKGVCSYCWFLPQAFSTAFVPESRLVSCRKSRHFGRHVFVRSERPEMTCSFQTAPGARRSKELKKSFEELETLICECLFSGRAESLLREASWSFDHRSSWGSRKWWQSCWQKLGEEFSAKSSC